MSVSAFACGSVYVHRVCIHVCVSMCVCMCLCLHVCVCVCVCVCIYVSVCLYFHVCLYIHVSVCACLYVWEDDKARERNGHLPSTAEAKKMITDISCSCMTSALC